MPKLPVISGKDAIRAFKRAGFEEVRGQGKGSHTKLVRHDPRCILTVPRKPQKGTLRALIQQADLTVDQFIDLL